MYAVIVSGGKQHRVTEGEVVRLTEFGAFVDLGGVDGLLPLSQMSWRWVEHPSDILKVGDKVKRGDIIVFRYPKDPDLDYVKRVVGVAGDN